MKRAGCCSSCGAEVYEVKTRWTNDLLNGEPRQLGAPLPQARRVEYALSNGSTAMFTFCAACLHLALDPNCFPDFWRAALDAFERELSPAYIAAIGNVARDERSQQHVEDSVAQLAHESIIGVVGQHEPWKELWGTHA